MVFENALSEGSRHGDGKWLKKAIRVLAFKRPFGPLLRIGPMRGFRFPALVLALVILLATPRPAQAAFLFCNRTQSLIEAAFGYRETADWVSEGWWQIQPGQCARVFSKPLTQRFYFYFARVLNAPKDGSKPLIWAGKSLFCMDNKAFKIQGYAKCEARGFREQGFQQVDVGVDQRDYTLTFQDNSTR